MAVPANRSDLRNLVREALMAWPEQVTTLTSAVASASVATISVDSVSGIAARMLVELESEIMRIRSIASLDLTVLRGDHGSTAATHSNSLTLKVWPFWGWTDANLNNQINRSIDWLYPEVWYPDYVENTAQANKKEFGLPTGARYPDGDIVKEVAFLLSDGITYKPVYGWRHYNDRLIFDHETDQARTIRILLQKRYARLTDDTTQISSLHSDIVDAIVNMTIAHCLESLLASRTKFLEYSASLNDRASTPDELQRQVFYFINQATLAKDRASRVPMSGFASTRKA